MQSEHPTRQSSKPTAASPSPLFSQESSGVSPGLFTPRAPKRQRTRHPYTSARRNTSKRESKSQYVPLIIVLVLVFLGVWLKGPGVPESVEGPFTRRGHVPSTSQTTAARTPSAAIPPHGLHIPEMKRPGIADSCGASGIHAIMSSLVRYNPFALFPNLTRSLVDADGWADTLTEWKAQQTKREHILAATVEEIMSPHTRFSERGSEEPSAVVTTSLHADFPSSRPLSEADLGAVEDAVTFLRVRLTKLQSLFTIINDDSRLSEKKRFELLEFLTANRRAAVDVGDYLCTPLAYIFDMASSTRHAGPPSIEALVMRDAPGGLETVEAKLGLPDTVLVADAADGNAGDDRDRVVRLSDIPALAGRVHDLQRKLLYTCYVYHTRKGLGSEAIKALFDDVKARNKVAEGYPH